MMHNVIMLFMMHNGLTTVNELLSVNKIINLTIYIAIKVFSQNITRGMAIHLSRQWRFGEFKKIK